jgi:uncharacterized membrane protein
LNDDSKNINIVGFHPLESSLVVLGYGAIVFNLFFLTGVMVVYILKKKILIPSWMVVSSFLFFLIQLLYFFWSK